MSYRGGKRVEGLLGSELGLWDTLPSCRNRNVWPGAVHAATIFGTTEIWNGGLVCVQFVMAQGTVGQQKDRLQRIVDHHKETPLPSTPCCTVDAGVANKSCRGGEQ